jgi:hypothetical protein
MSIFLTSLAVALAILVLAQILALIYHRYIHLPRRRFDQAAEQAADAAHRADERVRAAERCRLPPVPDGALVILIGINRGAALSNVSLVDEGPTHARERKDDWLRSQAEHPDEQTFSTQIHIEDGPQPLYLIATSESAVIWQFSGATDRIVRFAGISTKGSYVPRVGTVGLPKDRISVMTDVFCLQNFTDPSSTEGKEASEGVALLLGGRVPDAVVGCERLARVVLPSGSVSTDHPYPNASPLPTSAIALSFIRDEHSRYIQAVEIDPEQVISEVPVRRFDILPGAAGLAQLIDRGVLEIAEYKRMIFMSPRGTPPADSIQVANGVYEKQGPPVFRILAETQMPVGHGESSFFVTPGVAAPTNAYEFTKFVCETTRQPLKPGEVCPTS